MIFYLQTDEETEEFYHMIKDESPDSSFSEMKKMNYLIRVVRSQNELLEKINIFDEGLDDRIIEIMKVFYRAHYFEESLDDKEVIMLYVNKDGKDIFDVFVDNQYNGALPLDMEIYEKLSKAYVGELSAIREDIPFINFNWAFAVITQDKKAEEIES